MRYIRICLTDRIELVEIDDIFLCPSCYKVYEKKGDIFGVWDNLRQVLLYISDVESGWLPINTTTSAEALYRQLQDMSTEEDRNQTAFPIYYNAHKTPANKNFDLIINRKDDD